MTANGDWVRPFHGKLRLLVFMGWTSISLLVSSFDASTMARSGRSKQAPLCYTVPVTSRPTHSCRVVHEKAMKHSFGFCRLRPGRQTLFALLDNNDDDGVATPQTRIHDFLTKKAKQWMAAEISYYQGSQHYYPKIKNVNRPSRKHLMAAAQEYQRRFPFRTIADDSSVTSESCTESPFVLVANNVKDNWKSPFPTLNQPVRYLVMPAGEAKDAAALFVTSNAGPNDLCIFFGSIGRDVEHWIWTNQLQDTLTTSFHLDGVGYVPSKVFGPYFPNRENLDTDVDISRGGKPYARLVMEMEYAHRNGFSLRKLGFVAMNKPYTRLFVAVKVWKKNEVGNFGAAAILWGKDDHGTISVRRAIDFGTEELGPASKLSFEQECKGDPDMLPGVVQWDRPSPSSTFVDLRSELENMTDADAASISPSKDPSWSIVLPASDILYKVCRRMPTPYPADSGNVNVVDLSNHVVPECYMDLHFFAWFANESNFDS